ncbi:bactofilin family protein [Marinithermus hydrothermalis]|uniref:Cell shape determination protein CcmA n=1 Tax=Marinithermus hydrothermalis (strain DSM 14884 / JCM 11576 / T1) TaxID=869210 RepID=F2NQ22_MARHT|nr:polymer-forming cytoskeletal protein [Marinithermus hydrothermalis]AEB11123.1 protein of unknown function DUF583 [Marinithermus hydrothermalis DSM 14884]
MLRRKKHTNALTYLGAGTEVQGTLKVEGNLRVDGTVLGTVVVAGDLEVAPTGRIEGDEVRARSILVNGEIRARVIAEGKLTLTRTARLEGDVIAHALDIEAGATFVGRSVTGEQRGLPEPQAETVSAQGEEA